MTEIVEHDVVAWPPEGTALRHAFLRRDRTAAVVLEDHLGRYRLIEWAGVDRVVAACEAADSAAGGAYAPFLLTRDVLRMLGIIGPEPGDWRPAPFGPSTVLAVKDNAAPLLDAAGWRATAERCAQEWRDLRDHVLRFLGTRATSPERAAALSRLDQAAHR